MTDRNAMRRRRPRTRLLCAVAAWLAVWHSTPALAATASGSETLRPEYRWLVDAPLVAAGTGALLTSLAVHVDRQAVPAAGLDPRSIHWSIDRNSVGNSDLDARTWSDRWLVLAAAYPLLLPPLTAGSGERLQAMTDRLGMQAEAVVLTLGVVQLGKVATSRPRPYTYLPAADRPPDPHYDVTQDNAFLSMPSGHAATTWCAAGFATTDYLLSHPDQDWTSRAMVGFTGSVLATTTSALRVEAGQHFPTDVLVGSAMGAACGVAVPLLHHYVDGGERSPMPPASAWLQAAAGTAIGIGAGLALAPLFGD
jgi:membrane-associated phospholipid phosphatase